MRRAPLGPPPLASELRTRLAQLRERSEFLSRHADVGESLRESIAAWGSPTWLACEDHAWRLWIERHGDEVARAYLTAVDEELVRLVSGGASGADSSRDDHDERQAPG